MPRGDRILLLALALLASAAGGVLIWEGRTSTSKAEASADFQRLVGGLGFGPAVQLSPCPFGFDPRLDAACGLDHGLAPGGGWYCGRHVGAVLSYSPLPGARADRKASDAAVP